MTDEAFAGPRFSKPVIGAAIAVVCAAVGGWFYWQSHRGAELKIPESVPAEVALQAPAPEARIEHPVPVAGSEEPKSPLPDLNDSDKPISDALTAAAAPVAQYLVPESVIRHIVVTIDNLPRQKIAVDKRPLVPTPGAFMAEGDELHATLDSRNYQRYEPLVAMIRKADMQRFAGVYLRFYPLFQRAYQDLGYPTGYFNDRLVKVIDILLAAPQVTGPIELVRPNVMYLFADPTLEALPAGQKVLIRMGPDNQVVVKEKLMELRAIITVAAPKH